ncbi:AAA family ATPase [Alkalihalobacterium chitinilyticum]|uniref:Nuclease SbcCD subunit C n=1 Tax=Alkalihalobacterium chitinilyticum TaxID=2980103 RepID=A0ABT5VG72_9BACI|nr:SMC family ATPase [Alkalihalobacterium chitinilyticum]MDE5414429.1 SMC family ATPase [Alkalihalobacterium chitinilyticum]
MRPIKLTLTAFGPYKHKEVINFRDLKEHRLFVISGNTGAGKTSIFDAICFALYGEASGEDRNDSRMLRSHFAADEDHTSIDFEFELRGRMYRVFRQLAHIKGTNKTATGDKYELYEITDGQETLLVDRLTVTHVNEKLQEIIGLTKEQFSQIVMLPQGEFRKLLTSETEDKEEILRKIFKTGLFKHVTERLNEKRVSSQKVYEGQRQERDLHIKNISKNLPSREGSLFTEVFAQENYNTHQVLEALADEMSYYQQETIQQKQRLDEQNQLLQEKTKQFHEAKAINERFENLEMKRKLNEVLEHKIPEMNEKERELTLAETASQLEVHEGHYKEIEQELQLVKEQHEKANRELVQAEAAKVTAEKMYKVEEEKHEEREDIVVLVNKLKEYVPKVAKLDEHRTSLQQLRKEAEQLEKQTEAFTLQLKQHKEIKSERTAEIKRLETNSQGYALKVEQLQDMKTKVKAVHEYISLTEKQSQWSTRMQTKETAFGEVKKAYDELEALWVAGQASLLAEHLHDGESCPVCGSVEHPEKAIQKHNIPSKELLEQKRNEKDIIEDQFRKLQAELSTIFIQLETKQQELQELSISPEEPHNTLQQLTETEMVLQKEITQLKTEQRELEQHKKAQEQLEKNMEQTETEKLQVEKQYNQTIITFEKETTLHEQLLKDIPADLQSLEKLQNEVTQREEEKQKIERQWKAVQDALNAANERYFTTKTTIANVEKQFLSTSEKKEKAYDKFQEQLLATGFTTEEEYHGAKRTKLERDDLKEEIETFKTDLATTKKQVSELESELKGKERFDLVAFKMELQQLEQLIEKVRLTYIQMDTNVNLINQSIIDIESASEKVKEAEQIYYIHKDLYDVVRGDNAKRISFERYLLIEFLEQIVQVANQRLTRLSNGQFQLVRSDRLEKRGKQSGLSLDVYDNYTGQKRDVKTLSGGEKFNASLSLALGMADIIQSHQGGISIETMFIDEGFGSLDEESLSKAIDTLIELQQSGRLIGVISHVQELKQAIPAILDVKKTKEGHSQTAFVIK